MGKDESLHVTRRITRSSISNTSINSDAEIRESVQCPPTLDDLVFGEETISSDELLSMFPGRDLQILQLLGLLGPLNSPILPLFIYGGASTGKTSVTLNIFKHLNRPFVYSSCLTCYSPRILFESILNQLMLHRKSASNGYSSAKRCEKSSDFINFLREALVDVTNVLKKTSGKSNSKKSFRQVNGSMIYLIFDRMELVRKWDKSSNILPLLFNLYDILKMPEVGLIFISNTSPDTYYSNTGYLEPVLVHFPDYKEIDICDIFLPKQINPKLYSSFLDIVLRPFFRVTRRVDEVSTSFSYLFKKYCEPINDIEIVPNEEIKRKLFSHLRPHIATSLNEIFRASSMPSLENEGSKKKAGPKGNSKNLVNCEELNELDFHMSTSAKFLLISAFLASRNPATLDASLFDSLGGSDTRKRKRKSSEKSIDRKETAEQELIMKGPGSFPLERLLAIFQCITSVAEGLHDEQQEGNSELGTEGVATGLMSDVLLQLSSLCNANFISKGGSCPLEGSSRYRSTISEDMALKVARSLKFPLSKYLFR